MTDSELLTHFLFADDCILVAANPQDLEHDLQQLANLLKEIGLEMNPSKTKCMNNSSCAEGIISADDGEDEEVTNYVYMLATSE